MCRKTRLPGSPEAGDTSIYFKGSWRGFKCDTSPRSLCTAWAVSRCHIYPTVTVIIEVTAGSQCGPHSPSPTRWPQAAPEHVGTAGLLQPGRQQWGAILFWGWARGGRDRQPLRQGEQTGTWRGCVPALAARRGSLLMGFSSPMLSLSPYKYLLPRADDGRALGSSQGTGLMEGGWEGELALPPPFFFMELESCPTPFWNPACGRHTAVGHLPCV